LAKSALLPKPPSTVQLASPTPASVAPPPATIPQSTATLEQLVTITKPVTIQIPHGTTVLQRFLQRICAETLRITPEKAARFISIDEMFR
jgi:hypothetical protein